MHISVLLEESIKYLNLKEDSIVVDATLGYAGHSSEILKRIKKGFLFAFDQDIEAISESDVKLKKIGTNYKIIKSNFEYLKKHVDTADAILFDLGVSSPQLDTDERGFSFHKNGVLDMRMDKSNSLTAKKVVNDYSYQDLVRIFRDYGEEKYSNSIASNIIKYREKKEIEDTLELVEIISNSVPFKYKREHHPARKIFQAIRIEVNNELEVFENTLRDSLSILNLNGRIAVITFHSLEDKICKNIFKEFSEVDKNFKNLPVIPDHLKPKFKVIAKITPSKEEVLDNPRSRSATLRVIERVL